jgi:hypothetical protein
MPMITYMQNTKEEISKAFEYILIRRPPSLIDPQYPLINTYSLLTKRDLYQIFNQVGSPIKNFDKETLINQILNIDIKSLLLESIDCSLNEPFNKENFINDYSQFSIQNKIHFHYYINSFFSCKGKSIIRLILESIQYAVEQLNYAAFISNTKTEIDECIKHARQSVGMRLTKYMYDSMSLEETDMVDYINYLINPYDILYYDNATTTPFDNSEEYIGYLTIPYKYKIIQLQEVPILLNTNKNVLYNRLLSNNLNSICTYRIDEIVRLYVILQYLVYLIIAYVTQYTWECHEVSRFIYDRIHENTNQLIYIPESLKEKLIQVLGNNSYVYSNEAVEGYKTSNIKLDQIDESYKSKMAFLQKIYIKVFKIGISKLISKANMSFFKKYYGRIPHLYKQYGNEAEITESEVVDDPAAVLQTSCAAYIERLEKEATDLFNQLLLLARRVTSTANIKEKINILKSYCKKFPIQDETEGTAIKNSITAETRFRIISSILQNNEIYGYTIDGVLTNKKFPPANHIVVSLFIKNPHEIPRKQPITQIFKREDSLLLFAHPNEILKFNNIYKNVSHKIISTFNPKIASTTEKNMFKANRQLQYQLQRNQINSLSSQDNEEDNIKDNKKLIKIIEKSIVESIDMVVGQKQRCLQCAGIAHDMIQRVTDIAKRCIVAMLNVEYSKKDSGYDSGTDNKLHRGINKKLQMNDQRTERIEETNSHMNDNKNNERNYVSGNSGRYYSNM